MKRTILTIVLISLFCSISAQNTDFDAYRKQKQQAWATYKDTKQKAWTEYRDQLNKAYADKMRQKWQAFRSLSAIPIPKRPEPPKPTVKTNQAPVATKAGTVKEIITSVVHDMPEPVQPIPRPTDEPEAAYTFSFHSTPCKVHLNKNMSFRLSNANEATVAEAWQTLSASGYDMVADDCLNYRDQLDLNDWGYIELTKCLSQNFLGKSANESALMHAYLLVQSGYKVRLARSNDKLVLLMPFTNIVYEYVYILLDNEKYYVLDKNKNNGNYYVFNAKFAGEKTASLAMQGEPRFFDDPTPQKTFSSSRYPNISVSVSTNKNLMDFYRSCPVTSNWNEYAKASLSRKVKKVLYPALRKQLAGKTEAEAANILLNFVQTAFDYKTDQEQFGYERPLFGDEIFYYPYSDCEDRSILFSILVRELLKLDVVMLHYPGHLATAVHFPDEVSGYYFMVKNKKYVVCDPTYIGAPVGDCMPQFVGTSATIIEI